MEMKTIVMCIGSDQAMGELVKQKSNMRQEKGDGGWFKTRTRIRAIHM